MTASSNIEKLARRVMERIARQLHVGNDQQMCDDFTRVALAAITETQRLDAELAASLADQNEDTSIGRARNQTARDVAAEIRTGEHYGKDDTP